MCTHITCFLFKVCSSNTYFSLKVCSKEGKRGLQDGPEAAGPKRFGKHPTQKPFDLLKRIVLASTRENDLVLDPFAGSSTTGLAAYLYGRSFFGIDTERSYLDLSIKRFEELKANMERKRKQAGLKDWRFG